MEEKEIRTDQPETVLIQPQKKSPGKWIAGILLFLTVAAVGGFWLFLENRFHLELILEGAEEVILEYGQAYQEPGAQAVLRGRWLFAEGYLPEDLPIQIQTDLREDTLGKYTVTYSASLYGWTASASRSIRVVDSICPVISLNKSGKTVLPGQPYIEEGYVAVDNHDGNLTDQVRRVEEMGVITYTVIDSSGNPTSVQRAIPYFDPEAPELVLEGGEELAIPCGMIYKEPGYTATDNADGDLTEAVAVEGEVIWYQPGIYPVVYTVADTYGNVTQKVRTVTVEAQPWPEVAYPNGKVIYLTFDDGPGPYTGQLLDVLKHYGVKATFFVTDSGYDGTMWRIVNEGHSIGIHTMTHDYNTIYASEEAFFTDLLGMQEIIYRNTGVKTTLMRFPGGGSNLVSDYNEGIMTRLTRAVQDAGFQYFDWNVDSNDAGGARKKDTVVANVTGGVQNHRISVVLQHDIHDFSVAAVEDIIVWGLNNGYRFLPLTQTSPTMQHDVLN